LKNIAEKWLVISNCQTLGLSNAISVLCPDAEVTACDIWSFKGDPESWKNKLSSFNQLVISPEIQDLNVVDFSTYTNVTWVPGFFFRAYHPDLCYVFHAGSTVKTRLDDYNSNIVFAAYKQGLTTVQARSLFTSDVFHQIGYFDLWSTEKAALIQRFGDVGLDIRPYWLEWVKSGGFMHSINHPHIDAVFDVAKAVVHKAKGSHLHTSIRPHDNLINGAIFPVYPEIAERYAHGDLGSYLFKPMGTFSLLNLDQFIESSFAAYRAYNVDELATNSPHYDLAVQLIKERT